MTQSNEVEEIKAEHGIVGRTSEIERALAALRSSRHLLIEGPVGVGKTVLALAVAHHLHRPVLRVDGDERYTEQKLAGWFDPPVVLEKGYIPEAFVAGPLTDAMRKGGILFINEMNRMPEGVQNILLPAMDEGMIEVPKVGVVKAAPGFVVIATQNPREFVATTAISEALSDRFELLILEYQCEADEIEIVSRQHSAVPSELIERGVWITRRTRDHPNIRRGASIRAAMSIVKLAPQLSSDPADGLRKASHMSLPTRIELREESQARMDEIIDQIVDECLSMTPPEVRAAERARSEGTGKDGGRRGKETAVDVGDIAKIVDASLPSYLAEGDDLGLVVAQNYALLRPYLSNPAVLEMAKRMAIRATIRRVLQLLGPVSVPTRVVRHEFRIGDDSEIDLDATMENFAGKAKPEPSDIIVERREPRTTAVALMLDASLSMSGDKLAMATAAIAVLAFRMKTIDYALMTFNDRPKVIKRVDQRMDLDDMLSGLLESSALGYTNLDLALRKGTEELHRAETRNQVGVMITDGNYTVGEDPADAASSYRRLFIVMTESHDCRPSVCESMATSGRGRMYEVTSFDEIPRVLYGVLRQVAQGSPPSRHF